MACIHSILLLLFVVLFSIRPSLCYVRSCTVGNVHGADVYMMVHVHEKKDSPNMRSENQHWTLPESNTTRTGTIIFWLSRDILINDGPSEGKTWWPSTSKKGDMVGELSIIDKHSSVYCIDAWGTLSTSHEHRLLANKHTVNKIASHFLLLTILNFIISFWYRRTEKSQTP